MPESSDTDTDTDTATATSAPATLNPSKAALWASAFVVGALVILQAGRLPANPAYADQVSSREAYTLLTANAGRGGDEDPDEILVVIDNHRGVMMVYEAQPRTGAIVLQDGGSLPDLFRGALNR